MLMCTGGPVSAHRGIQDTSHCTELECYRRLSPNRVLKGNPGFRRAEGKDTSPLSPHLQGLCVTSLVAEVTDLMLTFYKREAFLAPGFRGTSAHHVGGDVAEGVSQSVCVCSHDSLTMKQI